MSVKSRIWLYSLILFLGISQIIIGALDGATTNSSFSRYMRYFGPIAAFCGLLTLIWSSVLLAFNNRPTSIHPLTYASVHCISMASMTLVWLAIAILVATQLPQECNFTDYSDGLATIWCALGASIFGVAILLVGLSLSAAIVVFSAARRSQMSSSGNIAHLDVGKEGYKPSRASEL